MMRIDEVAKQLEALGNPTRLKIYRTLVRAGEAGSSVGRLRERLKIAPSTLSHHVKTLVSADPPNARRDDARVSCEL